MPKFSDAICGFACCVSPAPFAGEGCTKRGEVDGWAELPDGRAGVEAADFRVGWPRLRDESGEEDILGGYRV